MNTYAKTVKDDPKDRIEIEIGDSKQANFYPQLKIKRWDNEVNVSFRLLGDTGTKSKDGDKIKYKSKKREVHFYELPVSKEHPEGASEIEVILLEKPDTNKIEFSIQSKGLSFYYQPELTQEEIDEGCVRPANIVGSYAVYHNAHPINYKDGKLYRSGKFGQIPKPRIEDSAGNWVWGELNIGSGKLTVTIPQDFLDNAVYPIKHAAGTTFGYTTIGASNVSHAGEDIIAAVHTSPEAGTIASMTAHIENTGGGSTNFKGILVLASNSNIITNGVGDGSSFTATEGWFTDTYTTPPTIATSTNYWVGLITDAVAFNIEYDESPSQGRHDFSNSYASPTNPTDGGTNDRQYSMYATYVSTPVEQEGFRFRDDDGSESAATFLAAQDTDITREDNTNTRLRILLDATNDPATKDFQLEYRLSPSGDWKKINVP